MKFKTSRADLIDPRADFHKRWLNYTQKFGESSEVVVVVESDEQKQILLALDALAERLKNEPDHFANVLYKISSLKIKSKGLQFLSPDELKEGLDQLKGYDPVLKGNWELSSLESLFTRLTEQFQQLDQQKTPSPQLERALSQQSYDVCQSLNQFLKNRNQFISPWPQVFKTETAKQFDKNDFQFFLNEDKTMGFLKAVPLQSQGAFGGPEQAIKKLRAIITDVESDFSNIKIGLTGIPVLESDEMSRSQSDMIFASILSFVGVGILLLAGFQGIKHPALALTMLAVGMMWAFGYTTATIGHLNILSVSFAAILIGLGIDFAIHYLARYLELRKEGFAMRAALSETSASVGAGILTAAVTTALAFYCATFTDFLGVAELGMIAGGGILLCALATFLFLPALIAIADKNTSQKDLPSQPQLTLFRNGIFQRPLLFLISSLFILILTASQAVVIRDGQLASKVQYDSNLLNLQATGIDAVDVQERIFQKSKGSLLFAVSMTDSLESCKVLREKFEALATVDHVQDLSELFPKSPHAKTRSHITKYQELLSQLPDQLPKTIPLNPGTIGEAIEKLYATVQKRNSPLSSQTTHTLDSFLEKFEALSLEDQMRFLQEYQMRIQTSLLFQFHAIRDAASNQPVQLKDLPRSLTSRFVSPQGDWLIQVYPKHQIWDQKPLEQFAKEVRSIDSQITGTPLQNYEASLQIQESYFRAALYAITIIVLVLLLDFMQRHHAIVILATAISITGATAFLSQQSGNPIASEWLALLCLTITMISAFLIDFKNFSHIIFALIPPITGATMMLGLLGIFNIDLNPANLIVLPLVLGIGVDDGVHVVHDFRNQPAKYSPSASTINAILLTSLTSMIGFGSMIPAAHRGLSSLGLVLVFGVGSCLFLSIILLPALLTIVSRSHALRLKKEELAKANAPLQ